MLYGEEEINWGARRRFNFEGSEHILFLDECAATLDTDASTRQLWGSLTPDALIFARSNRIVIIRGISDQSGAACSVACRGPLRFRVIADYVPGTADFSTHFY